MSGPRAVCYRRSIVLLGDQVSHGRARDTIVRLRFTDGWRRFTAEIRRPQDVRTERVLRHVQVAPFEAVVTRSTTRARR